MKIHRAPLLLAIIAVVMLAASGFGVRLDLWSFRIGFQILRWAAYGGLFAAALGLLALIIPKIRAGAPVSLVLSMVLGLATAYLPWHWSQQAQSVAPIHDISTDLTDPPSFVAILPLRADAPNPATYGGDQIAAAQRESYPDIQSLHLVLPPGEVFARALSAAHAIGWDVVATDAAAGRIEATATTFWFGFKDDVVVRIRPAPSGNVVDVRSVSRVGKSDVGTNAKRIRTYLAKLTT